MGAADGDHDDEGGRRGGIVGLLDGAVGGGGGSMDRIEESGRTEEGFTSCFTLAATQAAASRQGRRQHQQ